MNFTNYKQLALPDYGSKSNWAAAINDNFTKIDNALFVLSSEVANQVISGSSIQGDSNLVLYGIDSFNSSKNSVVMQFTIPETYTGVDTTDWSNVITMARFYIKKGSVFTPCQINHSITLDARSDSVIEASIVIDEIQDMSMIITCMCEIYIKDPTTIPAGE